jgi:hypothetical protein
MPPAPLVPTSSLRTLLTVVTMAAFLLMGMVAISWVTRLESAQWLAAALATAAMGGVTVRLSTASPLPPGASVGRTVGLSLVFGLANVPVSFLAASVVAEPDFFVIPMAAFAAVFGAPFGLMLGLLFGLALSTPVVALMRAWQQPSPEANDEAVVIHGLWLATMAVLSALLASPMLEPEFPLWTGPLAPWRSSVPHAIAWILGALGMTLAAAAWLRRMARRRFVARVAAGRVPAWRVAEVPEGRSELAHLPCMGESIIECDHLLLRHEHTGDDAYRRAAAEWPMAWVPRRWLRA